MAEEKQKPKEKEIKEKIVKTNKKVEAKSKTESKLNKEEVKSDVKKSEPQNEEEKDKKKDVEKKPDTSKPKIKKTEAVVSANNLPISVKHSVAVCKFIKNKSISKAIEDLEKVVVIKKPVPMKGEIPHKKGIMSGRYPKKTAEYFIRLLKSLLANSNFHEIENPIVIEAIANIGTRPYGRFGRVRRKKTHVKIVAKNIQKKKIEVKK